MKEFIDKLISRLEETDFNDIQMVVSEVLKKYGFPKESIVQDEIWDALDELSTNKFAIKIINELAEEFATDINVVSKNGWIPCSERLPEESLNSVLGWDEYRSRCCFVQYISGRWVIGNDIDSVKIIAWQPLPQPYKEGE